MFIFAHIETSHQEWCYNFLFDCSISFFFALKHTSLLPSEIPNDEGWFPRKLTLRLISVSLQKGAPGIATYEEGRESGWSRKRYWAPQRLWPTSWELWNPLEMSWIVVRGIVFRASGQLWIWLSWDVAAPRGGGVTPGKVALSSWG